MRHFIGIMALASLLCLAIGSGAQAQDIGDAAKGRQIAGQWCASCHGIEPTDRFSPSAGLATFRVIANTPGMTGIALAAFLQTPHKGMPDLIIPIDQRDDLIAYILSLRNGASN
jgi:mono/diheme cytochrome c family protein